CFAQARSVFAVAAQRCKEVFDPPECVTLWNLPQRLEDEFDAKWEYWLDHAGEWTALFQSLETVHDSDLTVLLQLLDVVSDSDCSAFKKLSRLPESRSVLLPGFFTGSKQDIAILALGFAKGDIGSLVVPYARTQER